MKTISLRKMVIVVVIISIAAGYTQADRQELLVKLNKKVEFEFKDIAIAEALDDIAQKLRIEIAFSDEAQWKLPQGKLTRLSASLKGSLAESLTEMLNAFFMRYAVGNEEITIYPRQELEHILGRPSTKQLEMLKKIYSMRIVLEDDVSKDFALGLIKEWFEAPSFVPYYVTEDIYKVLESVGTPVTLASVLDQVGFIHGIPLWCLSGMNFPNQAPVITMVNEEILREAKLDQVVDISFKNETAYVILQRLAGWTGMELVIQKEDPSWLEGEIIVNMQNIKLRQALRNIVSSADGEIDINVGDNRIVIYEPVRPRKKESVSEKPKSSGAGEGYVGKISIPMGEGESKYYIEFMLRESDLTEGLKKLREDKIKEIFRKVSKADDKALKIAARTQSYSILN
jgi:hypothetical protein